MIMKTETAPNLREYMRVAIFNTLTSFTNDVVVCLEFYRFIDKVKILISTQSKCLRIWLVV